MASRTTSDVPPIPRDALVTQRVVQQSWLAGKQLGLHLAGLSALLREEIQWEDSGDWRLRCTAAHARVDGDVAAVEATLVATELRTERTHETVLTLCNLPLLRDDGTLRSGATVITIPQAMVRSEGPWPQCAGPDTVAFVFTNNLVVFHKKGSQLHVGVGDGRMASVLELEAVVNSGVLYPDGDQEDPDKDARAVARAIKHAALSAVGVERTQSFLGQKPPAELTTQAVVTWAKAHFKDKERWATLEDATGTTPGWRLLTHVERLEIGIRVGLQRARSTWVFREGHQGVNGEAFMKRRANGATESLKKMVQESRQKQEPVFEPLHRVNGPLTATVTSWAMGEHDAGWGWITRRPKV